MHEASLDGIGFATISEARARDLRTDSPLSRCTLVLTETCNLSCAYCRKQRGPALATERALHILREWAKGGLGSLMISGGEPTLHPGLPQVVATARELGIAHIILASNGTAPRQLYLDLLKLGLNELSVSLDSGDEQRSGLLPGQWETIVDNIRALAQETRVVVGLVVHARVDRLLDDLMFIDSLGPADIKLTPSSQMTDRSAFRVLSNLPGTLLQKYPFLKYRVERYLAGQWARGLAAQGTGRCWLTLDDMVVSGQHHYPCYIYYREGGNPIGVFQDLERVRAERCQWMQQTDTHADCICREMCVDFYHQFNQRAHEYQGKNS